jgi:O-antigen ligase
VLWLVRARKALIAIILLVLPILIYLGNTEYGYTKSIFALITVSLLGVLWFVEMWVRRPYAIRWTPLLWPGLALVGAGALSMLHTQSVAVSLQSLNLLFYFGFFYLVLANSIESERDGQIFLGGLLGAALAAAVYGLLQYYGIMPGTPGFKGGQAAIISFMGNQNYLGGFLVYLLLPSLILVILLDHWIWKAAVFAALAICFYVLMAIDSASVWLSLAASLVFLLVAGVAVGLLRVLTPLQRRLAIASVLAIALAGTVIVAPRLLSLWEVTAAETPGAGLADQVRSYIVRVWEANSGETRVWDWWIGYEMWRASPLIGQGIGNYKLKFLDYKVLFAQTERGKSYAFYIPRAAQAHNEYVQVAAEMGMIGLLAVLGLLGTLFWVTLRRAGRVMAPVEKWALLTALAGVVAVMVDAIFSFPAHLPASALALVFLLGLLQSRWLRPDLPSVTLSPRLLRPVTLGVSALALSVIVLAARDWVADVCLDAGQNALRRSQPPFVIKELLEDCSLAHDFQPGEVLFALGRFYDQRANASEGLTRQTQIEYLEKSLSYYEASLRVFPAYETYHQIATLYLQRAAQAQQNQRKDEAEAHFQKAQSYLRKLLELQPDERLITAARFTLDVLLPLTRDPDRALSYVNRFLEERSDFERAYYTRGEIYRAMALQARANGLSFACQSALGAARADYDKSLELIHTKSTKAKAQLDAIWAQGQERVDQIQQLQAQLNAWRVEEAQIQRGQDELEKIKC